MTHSDILVQNMSTLIRVAYDLDIPTELRSALDEPMRIAGQILPGWLRVLRVRWEEVNDEAAYLRVVCDYEYRRTTMFATLEFLRLSKIDRELAVLHELLHIQTTPIDEVARRHTTALADTEESEAFGTMLDEELRRGCEATVSDLASALHPLLFH